MSDNNPEGRTKEDDKSFTLYFTEILARKVINPDVIEEYKKDLESPGILVINFGADLKTGFRMVMNLTVSLEGEGNGVLMGYGDVKKETGEAIIRVLGGKIAEVRE